MVDADRFKEINDRLGHAAGDTVLASIATGLTAWAGPRTAVGRLGGDEFAVVLELPQLAEALFRLFWVFGPGPVGASTLTLAEQGVREYEILAGLRPAGSTAPVDYDQLADITPNQYWEWPLLTGALQNMAQVHKNLGDVASRAAVMQRRVRVYERLVQLDPIKYQTALTQAEAAAAAFGP